MHTVIAQMMKIDRRDDDEREELFFVALPNGQVFSILRDEDVELLYKTLLKNVKSLSKAAHEVKKLLGE